MTVKMRALLVCGLVLAAGLPQSVVAVQQRGTVVVEGTVYDSVTSTPVSFAVVSLAEANVSTLTGRDGHYRLRVPGPGPWRLEVRKIGYRMHSMTVTAAGVSEAVDAQLLPLAVELETITVTAEAEDEATRIMRQAIARKNDVLARIHDYRYDAYIKFVVRDMDVDPDSIGSVFMITETQTTAYWEQPDKYQEVITARRQSTNLDAENNLVSVGQIVNFNRNRIDLQKYAVVSPTADDALDHYAYHLLDTLLVEGRRVFRLAIEPRSAAAPLFVGMIDVADSTYDVIAIDVGANDAVRFDFFENLRYRQRLAEFEPDYWMPQEIRFSGELHLGVPIPGFPKHISFVHTAALSNFRFDAGDAPASLGEFMIVVDEDADRSDSTHWVGRRTIPLTEAERNAWARIDSLEQLPTSLGKRLLTGTLGVLLLSNNEDFFHFNRVEGAYLGAGVTWRDLSPDVVLRARSGYAFGSDDWQHEYAGQYRLWEPRRLWIGASYRDRTVSRPTIIDPGRNSTFQELFAKADQLDYYREEGFSAFVSVSPARFTQLRLQYNDFDQTSAPVVSDYSIFNDDKIQRPNPVIRDGRLRSVSGAFTFDSRRLLKRKGRDFYLNTLTYTRVTLGGEYASPDFISNDFDYSRFYLRVHRRQRTLNLGLTRIDAFVGVSDGALPPQRYFTVEFGNNFFFQAGGFNTLEETNFSGNRAGMFYVSHNFDQLLFRKSRLPLIRDLPFTLSVHGGAFWTDFVDHPPNAGDQLVFTAPSAYGEIGFGLGNLTPMLTPFNFSAWFTWQVSSYDTDPFVLSIGIPGL